MTVCVCLYLYKECTKRAIRAHTVEMINDFLFFVCEQSDGVGFLGVVNVQRSAEIAKKNKLWVHIYNSFIQCVAFIRVFLFVTFRSTTKNWVGHHIDRCINVI